MPGRTRTTLFRASKFATLALLAAIGSLFVLPAGDASAAPPAFANSAIAQATHSDLTLVRDGCGRGMRFSNRRQTCVEDFGGGGPRVVEPGCPRGMRFSNSRGHCVEMGGGGGGDPGAAIMNGIVNGLIGNGCQQGWRFSNSRQRCVPNF